MGKAEQAEQVEATAHPQFLSCSFLFTLHTTLSPLREILYYLLLTLYRGGIAAGMSFGYGVGDIIEVSTLARTIWGRFRDASDQFNAIQTEYTLTVTSSGIN